MWEPNIAFVVVAALILIRQSFELESPIRYASSDVSLVVHIAYGLDRFGQRDPPPPPLPRVSLGVGFGV